MSMSLTLIPKLNGCAAGELYLSEDELKIVNQVLQCSGYRFFQIPDIDSPLGAALAGTDNSPQHTKQVDRQFDDIQLEQPPDPEAQLPGQRPDSQTSGDLDQLPSDGQSGLQEDQQPDSPTEVSTPSQPQQTESSPQTPSAQRSRTSPAAKRSAARRRTDQSSAPSAKRKRTTGGRVTPPTKSEGPKEPSREEKEFLATFKTDTQPLIVEPARNPPLLDAAAFTWQQACLSVLEMLERNPMAKWFTNPVIPEAEGMPDYLEKVTCPMDFHTIKQKLKGEMYTNPFRWQHDVRTVFYNAFVYHPQGSPIWRSAAELSVVFENLLKENPAANPYAVFKKPRAVVAPAVPVAVESTAEKSVVEEKASVAPVADVETPVVAAVPVPPAPPVVEVPVSRKQSQVPRGIKLREGGLVTYTMDCVGTDFEKEYTRVPPVSALPMPCAVPAIPLLSGGDKPGGGGSVVSPPQRKSTLARFRSLDVVYRKSALDLVKDELGIHCLLCALDVRYVPEVDVLPPIKQKQFFTYLKALILQQKQAQDVHHLPATLPRKLVWNRSNQANPQQIYSPTSQSQNPQGSDKNSNGPPVAPSFNAWTASTLRRMPSSSSSSSEGSHNSSAKASNKQLNPLNAAKGRMTQEDADDDNGSWDLSSQSSSSAGSNSGSADSFSASAAPPSRVSPQRGIPTMPAAHVPARVPAMPGGLSTGVVGFQGRQNPGMLHAPAAPFGVGALGVGAFGAHSGLGGMHGAAPPGVNVAQRAMPSSNPWLTATGPSFPPSGLGKNRPRVSMGPAQAFQRPTGLGLWQRPHAPAVAPQAPDGGIRAGGGPLGMTAWVEWKSKVLQEQLISRTRNVGSPSERESKAEQAEAEI